MSHTKVKTTYSAEGSYGGTITKTLYCHHNHSGDCVSFCNEKGETERMNFESWVSGDDLWDAVERLWFPFKNKWGEELKDKVEYYYEAHWEKGK